MTYNNLQLTKTHYKDAKQTLPVSVLNVEYRKQSALNERRSHGHFSGLLYSLFKLFSNKEKNMNTRANNDSAIIRNISAIKNDERQSLLDLEKCAKAARETEACGQYEWINTSDEK